MIERMPPTEEELHAFIDGELDEARTLEIAALTEADEKLAERIAAFRSDKAMIGRAYAGIDARPLPKEWLELIESRRRVRYFPPRRRWTAAIVAIAASLLLFVGATLFYRTLVVPSDEAIVAEALSARREAMAPQQMFAAENLSDPAARDLLLTQTLETTLKAPDLGRMGYRLASMRVYAASGGSKAVELRYRDTKGRLFTLYLRRPTSAPRVDLINRGGLRICIWQDDVVGTVMLGEMSAAEMARLASLAYAGLNL